MHMCMGDGGRIRIRRWSAFDADASPDEERWLASPCHARRSLVAQLASMSPRPSDLGVVALSRLHRDLEQLEGRVHEGGMRVD
jgi:hypothetical protein